MQKNFGIQHLLNPVCLAVLLGGCASDPQPAPILSGERMLRESEGMAQLGSRWQQGKQMVDRGQALRRDGQAKIAQGDRMIEEGRKIMYESEEGYKNIKQ